MKFRKRPVVIEATQWFKLGDHPNVIIPIWSHDGGNKCDACGLELDNIHGCIDTLEGVGRVCPGDWIITGIKGEKYPCKPDIFKQTYESILQERPTFDKLLESLETVGRERDAAIERAEKAEKEHDEAMKLAYIGEHRFPQNSWKVRCEEEVEGRRTALERCKELSEDVEFLKGRAELCGRFCSGWPQRDFGACANALVRLAYGGEPPREDEYAYDQEDAMAAFRALLHMPAYRCTHAVMDAFRKATENART